MKEPGGSHADDLAKPLGSDLTRVDPTPPVHASPHRPVIDADLTEISPGPAGPEEARTTPVDRPAGAIPDAMQARVQLRPGLRIKQYELMQLLGRGGMGEVHLARDTRLGRRVAIKFLHARSQQVARRFLVEARATARCTHENIVVIHEVGEHKDVPYMVLEYLEGEPLSRWLGHRRLPAPRAVELMAPVVRALVRAHAFDIVHRDLKPDNVFVCQSGAIKVLDFGIAKVRGEDREDETEHADAGPAAGPEGDAPLTRDGDWIGTMQYMAPEQWGAGEVDGRADVWAVGLMLHEVVAGRHPLAGLGLPQLMSSAADLDTPLPSVGEAVPELPTALEKIIDRCLAKRPEERYPSAVELLEDLEPLLPGHAGHRLGQDDSPYPGLTAFSEADAGLFFGRTRETALAAGRVREHPLVGVVGPSGVGKSSFVRAGLVPSLKQSGEPWEVLTVRPGRAPLASLSGLLHGLARSTARGRKERQRRDEEQDGLLRREPGHLGEVLRAHARKKETSVLVFVDQFEELYTLVPDPEQRRAFTASLAGAADDAASPLRVVVAMRSDLLDRAAEDREFLGRLTPGLVFLQTPDSEGLRDAITQPLELSGHRFESDRIVQQMLEALEATPGALPLMQFAASRLWDRRDRKQRLLTEEAFDAMGGVGGALSTHADAILDALPASDRRLVRAIFQRLVTSEGTRALVDLTELCELPVARPREVRRVVDYLVQARLLVSQTRSEAEGPVVEVVHESLLRSWPTLRRWLDEDREVTAYLEQLRGAARQWEGKGRAPGLLWTGEAEEEARVWSRSYMGELPPLEREYLDAVFQLRDRTRRRRRWLLGGAMVLLAVVAAGAILASVLVSQAEQRALDKARAARKAEQRVTEQLELVRRTTREKQRAEAAVSTGKKKLKTAETRLRRSYSDLEGALKKAQAERAAAEAARRRAQTAAQDARDKAARIRVLADAEKKARATSEKLLARERERLRKLKQHIATELK